MATFLKAITRAAEPFHRRTRYGRDEAQARAAYTSRTVYVGNLAFVTTDVQLHAAFSRCGAVDRVVMGINRETKAPCGFAFVIFMRRADAAEAVGVLDGAVLDERVIKVEMDKGFHEGKQYGRGVTGGQVRDELRADFDEGRGGFGLAAADEGAGGFGGSGAGGWRGGARGGGGGRGRRRDSAGGEFYGRRSGGAPQPWASGGKRGRSGDDGGTGGEGGGEGGGMGGGDSGIGGGDDDAPRDKRRRGDDYDE
jgi:nuclear cap-binding protein subunit 2